MAQPTEHHTMQTSHPGQSTWFASRRTLVTVAALGVLYGVVVALPTPPGLTPPRSIKGPARSGRYASLDRMALQARRQTIERISLCHSRVA